MDGADAVRCRVEVGGSGHNEEDSHRNLEDRAAETRFRRRLIHNSQRGHCCHQIQAGVHPPLVSRLAPSQEPDCFIIDLKCKTQRDKVHMDRYTKKKEVEKARNENAVIEPNHSILVQGFFL